MRLDGLVEGGIEGLALGADLLEPHVLEQAEELALDDLDAVAQPFEALATLRGFDGAVEVVEDLEELLDELVARALDFGVDLTGEPRGRLVEAFLGGLVGFDVSS